jgi:hypothetical protein
MRRIVAPSDCRAAPDLSSARQYRRFSVLAIVGEVMLAIAS